MNKNYVFLIGGLTLMFSIFATKKYLLPEKGEKYSQLFSESEARYKLPKNMLARIAQQESYFNPRATNRSGAKGMMQIIPRWHPEVSDPFDPYEAVPYAGKYLRQLYNRFKRWDYAIAGYNWGPTNVAKWVENGANFSRLPEETRNYINNVSKDVKLS